MVFEIVSCYSDFYCLENTLNKFKPVKKKRRCVDITASQKHDLCLHIEQNAKATQVDILAYFSKTKCVAVAC